MEESTIFVSREEFLNKGLRSEDYFCGICYELYDSSHEPAVTTCKHVFGFECIKRHILSNADTANRCPKCRNLLFISFESHEDGFDNELGEGTQYGSEYESEYGLDYGLEDELQMDIGDEDESNAEGQTDPDSQVTLDYGSVTEDEDPDDEEAGNEENEENEGEGEGEGEGGEYGDNDEDEFDEDEIDEDGQLEETMKMG